MSTTDKPVAFGPFPKGMNNRAPDTHLGEGFLRSAVNVDLSDAGLAHRRNGTTLALAGTGVHSFWSNDAGAYLVDGNDLYVISGPPSAPIKTLVRQGMAPGKTVSYCDLGRSVAYTDGKVLRQLIDGVDTYLTVPMFNATPMVAAGGAGSLVEGKYQACFSYFDDNFMESGSTEPVQIEVAAGQAIQITQLPAAFPDDVAGLFIYLSEPNGDLLMLAAVLASPQATFNFTTKPQLTGQCGTLLYKPLPPGQIVRRYKGRLLVANGALLSFSEPYSFLHMPSRDFIAFEDPITMIEAVSEAVYVGTKAGQVYHFAGDLAGAQARRPLPYGVVPGTSGVFPNGDKCWWMSDRGMVIADSGAQIQNVQEAAIAVNPAKAGASFFREQDGTRHIVSSLFGSENTAASARTFMEAEVLRRGTVL